MPQPIRKVIKETHPDLIKEPPFLTLLVDGNSLLFMAMRDETVNSKGEHYGGVFQFLLQLKMQLQKRTFKYVYVFFDDEYSGKLRYDIYHQYKANRDKHYSDYSADLSDYAKEVNAKVKRMQDYFFNKENRNKKEPKTDWDKFIDANFNRERNILMQMFEELYIRCYMDEITEGDDLIAYYCKNKKENEKIVIISGDEDITQLTSDEIVVYNLKHKAYIYPANFKTYFGYHPSNVVLKKILVGDTSDNIGNIRGLSEERLYNLMPEIKDRPVTLSEVKERAQKLTEERKSEKKKPLQVHENIINGVSNKEYNGDFYEINDRLINLSKPILSKEAKEEMDALMYAPIDPEGRSFENLYLIVKSNNIEKLCGETNFASFFCTFKVLEKQNDIV